MILYKLKISTRSLEQLKKISEFKNISHKEVLEKSIEDYHTELNQLVYPKEKYFEMVSEITNLKPPYHVKEEHPSITGNSNGALVIKNCNIPMPASWFKNEQPLIVTTKHYFICWIILQIIFQIIIVTLLIL